MALSEGAQITFVGCFAPHSFEEFVAHRGRKLALEWRILHSDRERVSVALRGQPAFLDAFEMACSLGPADCLVRDVVRDGVRAAAGADALPAVAEATR